MAKSTLEIRYPWTMPYLDDEQIFIDALRDRIAPEHPLYARDVCVIALRRDPDAVIYLTVDEPHIFALVDHSRSPMHGRRRENPKTELLESWEMIAKRIDGDHAEWVAQFTRDPTT